MYVLKSKGARVAKNEKEERSWRTPLPDFKTYWAHSNQESVVLAKSQIAQRSRAGDTETDPTPWAFGLQQGLMQSNREIKVFSTHGAE